MLQCHLPTVLSFVSNPAQASISSWYPSVPLRESVMVKSILFFNTYVFPHQIEFFGGGDHLYQFLAYNRYSVKVWIILACPERHRNILVTSWNSIPLSAVKFFSPVFTIQTLMDRLLTTGILNCNFFFRNQLFRRELKKEMYLVDIKCHLLVK